MQHILRPSVTSTPVLQPVEIFGNKLNKEREGGTVRKLNVVVFIIAGNKRGDE